MIVAYLELLLKIWQACWTLLKKTWGVSCKPVLHNVEGMASILDQWDSLLGEQVVWTAGALFYKSKFEGACNDWPSGGTSERWASWFVWLCPCWTVTCYNWRFLLFYIWDYGTIVLIHIRFACTLWPACTAQARQYAMHLFRKLRNFLSPKLRWDGSALCHKTEYSV